MDNKTKKAIDSNKKCKEIQIKKNNKKGITLIALVVTIVVLLILAGVSITAVFGDNGLLQMAKEAANKTNEAVGKEQETMENVSGILGEYTNGDGDKGTQKVVTEPLDNLQTAIQNKKLYTDTTIYVDEENNPVITIPAEFTVVPSGTNSVEYSETPTVADGIVITDKMDEAGNVTGNEFVWVPVPEINDMVRCKTHLNSTITFDKATKKFICSEQVGEEPILVGKLYDFSGKGADSTSTAKTSIGSYREPDILTDTGFGDAVVGNTQMGIEPLKSIVGISTTKKEGSRKTEENEIVKENWEDELRTNFDKMIKSVAHYKGFYIGRYETGNLKSGTVTKAVVQKERTDIASTSWYCMYASSKDIAYKNERDKITSVTSSMIWGSQWDATLNWFLKGTDEEKDYVTNSTGWYSEITENDKHATGKDVEGVKNKVKNIYDMAGNVYDWTIEAYGTNLRVVRGGCFNTSSSGRIASSRTSGGSYCPGYVGYEYSSRSTLIVNL